MNINTIEREILKAINIERQGIKEEDWSPYTKETFEDRFIDLEKFVCKLFTEYKGEEWETLQFPGEVVSFAHL